MNNSLEFLSYSVFGAIVASAISQNQVIFAFYRWGSDWAPKISNIDRLLKTYRFRKKNWSLKNPNHEKARYVRSTSSFPFSLL